MSLPNDYQVEKVTSALAEIKIYIEWEFDGIGELFVWLQNTVDGLVFYQTQGDFTVTEGLDVGGVFILVENDQGVSVDVSVSRITPKTQTYDLSNSESLNPAALIASLDKSIKMIQELFAGYDNQSITSVNFFEIPSSVERANTVMIFNEFGDTVFQTLGNLLSDEEIAGGTDDNRTGTAEDLVLTNKDNQNIYMNNAAANTLTIPLNATIAFPIGTTKIPVIMEGAGTTTIDGASGVTINGVLDGSVVINNQFQGALLQYRSLNNWLISGDIT